MTTPERDFDDALAFVQLFARGSWTSCHVRTDKLEIFVSREARRQIPMATPRAASRCGLTSCGRPSKIT